MTRHHPSKGRLPWRLLVRLFGLLAVVAYVYQLSGPLSPYWTQHFRFSALDVGLVSSAQYLGAALFALPAGWLVDRFAPNVIGSVSLVAMAIVLGMASLTSSVVGLAVAFFFVGLLRTPLMALCNVLVFRVAPRGRLNASMAVQTMGIPFGGAVAGVSIPWLVQLTASSSIPMLATGGLVGAVGLLFSRLGLPAVDRSCSPAPDPLAARGDGHMTAPRFGLLQLSIVAVGLTAAESIVMTFFVLYCVEYLMATMIEAGAYLAIVRVCGAAGRIPLGHVADAVRSRSQVLPFVTVGVVAALSLLLLSRADSATPRAALVTIAGLLGVGCVGWVSLAHAASVQIGGQQRGGLANGWVSAVMRLAAVLSPPLFAVLADEVSRIGTAWQALALMVLILTAAPCLPTLRRRPNRTQMD